MSQWKWNLQDASDDIPAQDTPARDRKHQIALPMVGKRKWRGNQLDNVDFQSLYGNITPRKDHWPKESFFEKPLI